MVSKIYYQTSTDYMIMMEKKETKPLIVVDKVRRVDALKYSKLVYPPFIISENSQFYLIWQIILMVSIICDVFINSFEISFLRERIENERIQRLVSFVVWVYFLDFVIRSNTTFTNSKSEEMCLHKEIFENYRKTFGFYIDLLAFLPFESLLLSLSLSSNNLIKRSFAAHRLFKLYRLGESYRNIEKRTIHKIVFMTMRVIFQLSFQLHIISCLWYAVVFYAYQQDKESAYIWLPPQLRMAGLGETKGREDYYESKDLLFKYTHTFYCVLAQMSGNDINVSDETQVFLSIVIGLLGSVNLGVIFGNVMLVYQKLNSTSAEYVDKLNKYREDLEEHGIPQEAHEAGLKYLEFCFNIKK